MAGNTSPSWREPALSDVEASEVVEAAAVAQDLVAPDVDRAQRLSNPQLPQLKAETMLRLLRPRPRS